MLGLCWGYVGWGWGYVVEVNVGAMLGLCWVRLCWGYVGWGCGYVVRVNVGAMSGLCCVGLYCGLEMRMQVLQQVLATC